MSLIEWKIVRALAMAGVIVYATTVLVAVWLRPSTARRYPLLAQLGVGQGRKQIPEAELFTFRRYWRWLRIMVATWVVVAGSYFAYTWIR